MSDSFDVAFNTDMELGCSCGWRGTVSEIEDWEIDEELDHVARVCPGCQTPVPEWGAFHGVDGVEQIAKGDIRDSLASQ